MKEKIKFVFDHMEEIVLVPGFAIMLVINFANVLCRFVLKGKSWAFTEELCVMMFVYITFFGAAVAVKRRQHLGFTLILEKLPAIPRMAMDTVIMLAVVGFLVIMIVYGTRICLNQIASKATTAALRISTAWGNVCIPVGGVFIILRTVQIYLVDMKAHLEALRGKKEGRQ